MITPDTILITENEIIQLRDKMKLSELRKITNECKEKNGYVSFHALFETMGYIHAYNDK